MTYHVYDIYVRSDIDAGRALEVGYSRPFTSSREEGY